MEGLVGQSCRGLGIRHASGAISCSSEVFERLGRAEGKLPDRLEAWLELVHPEDRGHVLDRLPTRKPPTIFSMRPNFGSADAHPNGFASIAAGALSHDAGGKPLKTAGLILDISDWQANRRELGELVPVGFYCMCHYVSDNSLRFLYLNDRSCKITGWIDRR